MTRLEIECIVYLELTLRFEHQSEMLNSNRPNTEIDLSDTQFAIVAKILGLEINHDGSVNCFSDETLKRFIGMDSNPLKLKKI